MASLDQHGNKCCVFQPFLLFDPHHGRPGAHAVLWQLCVSLDINGKGRSSYVDRGGELSGMVVEVAVVDR